MKIFEKIKKCFSKESYSDESVYKFNISIFIASVVLFCAGCVMFFM